MPQLLIVDPQGSQQRLALTGPECVLGRDPSATVTLKDRKISRRHARVVQKGDAYWIEDLGSANGVLMDGRPISGPRKLTHGARFEIGGHAIVFEDEPAAAATTFALIGRNGPYAQQSFLLPTGDLAVGRVDGNAIVIPDVSVSRQHALLHVSPAAVVVEDLDSSNGTWVNGVRVARRELAATDRVRFGNIEFELRPAGGGLGFNPLAALIARLRRADRTVQIAALIGALSVVLLVVTLVVALRRPATPGRPPLADAGALEEAYEKAVQDDLAAARTATANGAWTEAGQAFQRVLERDPINREARRGVIVAEQNRQDEQLVEAARTLVASGQPAEALGRLNAMSPDSRFAAAAREVGDAARQAIAAEALTAAGQACQKSDWRECHRQAVRALEHRPDSVPGLALVNEAENAMRSRRMAFTPWAPPRPAGTAASPNIDALYGDDGVRFAVLRYAAGDLETAVARIQTVLDRSGGSAVNQALTELRRAKTAGDGAAAAGDAARAIKAWEEALAADAKILPPTHPSAFRDDVRRRLTKELYRLGDAAFGRGSYGDAAEAWIRGLGHNPADAELLAGMAKLESRAQAMLADLPRGKLRRDGCQRLAEILAMTRPESGVHDEAAKRRKGGCD